MDSLHPRLIAGTFFGVPATMGLTRVLAASELIQAARTKAGGAPGLVCIGEQRGLLAARGFGEIRRAPVTLERQIVFSSTGNLKGNWTAETVPNAADWEELPNPFGGKTKGLLYSNGRENQRARFRGGFVAGNGGFALRLWVFQPDFETKQVLSATWGADAKTGAAQWRFEMFDGRFSLQRLTPSWTQGAQDALEALQIKANSTEAEQVSIAASRAALYQSEHSLDVDGQPFAREISVSFEADECGAVWVRAGGGAEQVIALPDFVANRTVGAVWNAGALRVGVNHGAFMWQRGDVSVTRKARLMGPVISWPYSISLEENGYITAGAFHAPPGTSVEFGLNRSEADSTQYQLWAELKSDGARAPVLHDLFFSAYGGARSGTNTTVLDTEDYLRDDGSAPFANITVNWEAETRALCLDVELLEQNGEIQLPGVTQEFLAERTGGFSLGGVPLIANGIIQEPALRDAANPRQNAPLVHVAGGESTLTLRFYDWWFLADEWLLREQPVGDDLFLGEYIKLLLSFPGFKIAELAGIVDESGPRLPKAAPGERPAVMPGYEQPLGDFLRQLLADYAPDWILDAFTGVWRLRERSRVVRCAFVRDVNGPRPAGLPQTAPMFEIFEPLDIIRDHRQVKTDFCARGADGTPGADPRHWRVQELVKNSLVAGHQGRIKRAPTRQNDAWRTEGAVNMGARYEARLGSRPGRFFGFESSFCLHLVPGGLLAPGDLVMVCGTSADGSEVSATKCEIESLDGGSIERGNSSLAFLTREFIRFA